MRPQRTRVTNVLLLAATLALVAHAGAVEPANAEACRTLRITDRAGVPIPGAHIEVALNHADTPLASGDTDAQGEFCTAGLERPGDIVVTITAPTYVRWAMISSWAHVEQPIHLDRELDEAFLKAAVAETDPDLAKAMMMEIVGVRQMGLDQVALYPYIGDLRDKLLPFTTEPIWQTPDDRGLFSPASRASNLLSLWCDPRDVALIQAYITDQKTLLAAPKPMRAATVGEVTALWADHHFEQEGASPHPYWYPGTAMGLDGEHALVTFTVRYAHWGYSILLVMRRDEGQWALQHTVDWEHFHFDR